MKREQGLSSALFSAAGHVHEHDVYEVHEGYGVGHVVTL